MATQYTGGQVAGGVLTAATLNSIGAAWETWTPTVSAASGTITSSTIQSARYARINKIVTGQITFTITNVGTGTGSPIFTLPITAAATVTGVVIGSYRETALTGFSGIVLVVATGAGLFRYDNGANIGTGRAYSCSFTYEAA